MQPNINALVCCSTYSMFSITAEMKAFLGSIASQHCLADRRHGVLSPQNSKIVVGAVCTGVFMSSSMFLVDFCTFAIDYLLLDYQVSVDYVEKSWLKVKHVVAYEN